MRRWLLAAVGLAALALAAWELPVLVARLVVYEEVGEGQDTAALELDGGALVDEVLAPSLLAGATLVERGEEEREDAGGAWSVHRSRWKLPEGAAAPQVARRLASVLEDADPRLDAYVTTDDELDASLRVYAGKRLLAQLALEPTLGAPPAIEGERPLVAVVVTGLGEAGGVAEALLASPLPFSVALEPFAPFTLRLSRDAILRHKEVLVELGPEQELLAALEAVPYASGVLVGEPPRALPAAALSRRDLYLLDGTGQVEAAAVRAARNAGVAVLSVDLVLGEEPGASLQRARHLAALHGRVVLLVGLDDPGRQELFRWLSASADELRLAFVTEVVDLERLGLDGAE